MATVACSLTGSRYYNNGWIPSSGWNDVNTVTGIAGENRAYCMRFTVPTTSGSFTGVSFTVSVSAVKNTDTSPTLKWGISTSSAGTKSPSSLLWQGTWNFKNITVQHQKYTATTGTINLSSSTSYSGTLYLWIWGDSSNKRIQLYKNAPAGYYSAAMNYTAVTACSAPSSVSATTRIGRGKTATVSWSGASAGVTNNITGYRIYYSTSGTPTTSSSYWSVSTSSTSGRYTTGALSTTQGTVYRFKVMTIGSAGSSYYSGLSGSTPTTTINTTPTLSAFSVNTPIVSSRGDKGVTFSITRADANGDTIYARFYRVSGATYTQIGTETTGASMSTTLTTSILPENLAVNGVDSSYTFAVRVTDSYDSWTYYAERTLTITRKAKPIISSLSVSAANTPTYRTNTDNNTFPFTTLINASRIVAGTVVENGWRIRVSPTLEFSGIGIYISGYESLSTFNISNYVNFGDFYQIGLQVGSGYEYSDIVWKTTGYSSGGRDSSAFYMAPAVEPRSIGNKHSTYSDWSSDVAFYEEANIGDFSEEISLTHTYNSLYTVTYLWSKSIDLSGATQIGDSTTGRYGANQALPSAISAFNVTTKTDFYFFIKTTHGSLSTNSSAKKMSKIKTNPLSEVIFNSGAPGSIKPIYTHHDSTYTSNFTRFWGSDSLKNYYNIPDDFSTFNLFLVVNEQVSSIHKNGGGLIDEELEATMLWGYSGEELYNWDTNVLGLTFNNNYTGYLRLTIKDLFNNTYTINSQSFTLSLRESPLFPAISADRKIYYDLGFGESESLITQNVNEGYQLRFTSPVARTYGGTILNYEIQICRSNTILNNPTLGDYSSYSNTFTLAEDIINFVRVVGPVTSPYYCYFRIVATDPLGQTDIKYYDNYRLDAGELQRISPNYFNINNASINAEQTTISFQYLFSNAGGGLPGSLVSYDNLYGGRVLVNIEYSFDGVDFFEFGVPLLDASSQEEISGAVTPNIKSDNFILSQVIEPFIYLRLKATVHPLRGNSSVQVNVPEYITYSNTLVIPNIQPTIAYRKGHVGINNRSFEEDEVLVINVGPNGRKKVKFMSADWQGIIDLETGEMSGFIISGGSWDV